MNRPRNFPKKGYVFLISLLIVGHNCFSQLNVTDNFVSASYFETNTSYSTQWAIGEIFTESFTSGGVSVSTGLNENNIAFIVMDLETTGEHLRRIQAFPNPMTGVLTIASDDFLVHELKFDFMDGSGKQIEVPSLSIDDHSASFNTEQLAAGIYLLSVKNLKTTQTAFIKLIQK